MKLDMSRAWNDATAMISANKEMVLVLAGVFFFLPYLVLMLMLPDMSGGMPVQTTANSDAAMEQMLSVYADNWWAFLLIGILQGIGMLAGLALLGASSRPTVKDAIASGVKGLLPYIGVQILQTLILLLVLGVPIAIAAATGSVALMVIVGLLAFIGFLYLFTKFSLAPPAIAIDGVMNPVTALKRSWELTKGNTLRLFLFYALLLIALVVVAMLVAMILGLIFALMGAQAAVIGNGIVAALINAAYVMVFLAAWAAVHRQLAGPSTESIRETFE